jgi:hypothetical protein
VTLIARTELIDDRQDRDSQPGSDDDPQRTGAPPADGVVRTPDQQQGREEQDGRTRECHHQLGSAAAHRGPEHRQEEQGAVAGRLPDAVAQQTHGHEIHRHPDDSDPWAPIPSPDPEQLHPDRDLQRERDGDLDGVNLCFEPEQAPGRRETRAVDHDRRATAGEGDGQPEHGKPSSQSHEG